MVRFPFGLIAALGTLAAVGTLASLMNADTAGRPAVRSFGGEGAATVSRYAVSNVSYTVTGLKPRRIRAVRFSLTATDGCPAASTCDPATVRAALTGMSGFVVCSGGPQTWTCDFPGGIAAQQHTQLRIIAVQ